MLDGFSFSFSLRRESRSLDDELDLRSRFDGGDFRERFRRLLSDDEDDELLSLDRERDLERDLERVLSRRLERFELTVLRLPLFSLGFLRRPNSSYSESEDSGSLYSTFSRSL